LRNELKFVIPYALPGLNDYIKAERGNRFSAAKMKREAEEALELLAKSQLRHASADPPVFMEYLWVEKDRRRDKDNVSSLGRKFIQDALVRAGVLRGDGWSDISGFSDKFAVDKSNPRVEVTIKPGKSR
jgi:Holliday junction resolvase RusA-like endonuclease